MCRMWHLISQTVSDDDAEGTGSGSDAQGDTLTGIENLIGSASNDNNVLTGGAGNDMVLGGAGDDTHSVLNGYSPLPPLRNWHRSTCRQQRC